MNFTHIRKNKKVMIISCVVVVVALAGALAILGQNARAKRLETIATNQKKIESLQETKKALDMALTMHDQIKAAVGTAKWVRSASEIGLGISQGWIHGCEDEQSSSCQTLKACTQKEELIQWDNLDKIRTKLAGMPQNIRKDVDVWLNTNTRQKIGLCIAENWAANPADIQASNDTSAILTGHKEQVSKDLSDLESKSDSLRSQPYFLWLSVK